jgi:predicted transcriptional regulator
MKRNKLEIIRDILEIINKNNNSITITPLIRKSNLSTTRFNSYFLELLRKNFVIERERNNKRYLSLAPKGFQYLERYSSIIGFIEEFEL